MLAVSKVNVSLPLSVRVGVNAAYTMMLPAVDASVKATATAVDQVDDALAVNVTLPELEMAPLAAVPKLTTWRA